MQKHTKVKLPECYYTPKQLRDLIFFLLSLIVAITTIISNIHNILK